MGDIELVIKIPEEIRLALINNIQLSPDQKSMCDLYIKHAIINGTPLDDVKAEIDKLHKVGNGNDGKVYVPINDVFDVIDKAY